MIEKDMTERTKQELEGLRTQWIRMCSYVEKIDTEHWTVFSIVFASLGLFSLINVTSANSKLASFAVYWITPIALMLVIYYEAYRLREVAILKGYLVKIEKRINIIIQNKNDKGEDKSPLIFEWFSTYDINYMSHNNLANRILPVPVAIVIFVLYAFFFYNKVIIDKDYLYLTVLIITFAFDLIAFISIIKTEKYQTQAMTNDLSQEAEKQIEKMQRKHLRT